MIEPLTLPPKLSDIAWLAELTELDREPIPHAVVQPRTDREVRREEQRVARCAKYNAQHRHDWTVEWGPETKRQDYVSQGNPAWNYAGCVRDQGYYCGPTFEGGPLNAGHAHGRTSDFDWPSRYGTVDGWYALTDGVYRWITPVVESPPM